MEDSRMLCTSASVSMVDFNFINGYYQSFHCQEQSQLPPTSLGNSAKSASVSDIGTLQTAVLGFGVCINFKSRIPVSYSPLALLNISPADFQSQTFWGLVFSEQGPHARSPVWGTDPSLLGEDFCNCGTPLSCELTTQECGFLTILPLLSTYPPIHLVVLYVFSCGKSFLMSSGCYLRELLCK